MKRELALLGSILTSGIVAGLPIDVLADDCPPEMAYVSRVGDNCNRSDSLRVVVTNNCQIPRKIWICLKRADWSWDCGLHSNVPPYQKVSNFICSAAIKDAEYFAVRDCAVSESCAKPR